MTRDQQIKFALGILNPEDRAECRADIVQMLDIIDEVMKEEGTMSNSKETKAKVQRLHKALDEVQAAYNALPDPLKATVFKQPDLHSLPAACKLFKSKSLKRPAERQRLATVAAQALLIDYDIKRTVTRRGPWYRLAAVLYGDRTADLFAYLREFKDLE